MTEHEEPRRGITPSWRELICPLEEWDGTERCRDGLAWALDVHERFFGDAWLAEAFASDSLPFMDLSEWPIRGQAKIANFIERACQLQLLGDDWGALRAQLQARQARPSVEHLRLITETAGWVMRAGYGVEFEPEIGTGKRPDLLVSAGATTLLIEVTAQGSDRDMRQAGRFGDSVDLLRRRLEADHGVVVTVRTETVLDDAALRQLFADASAAAAQVVSSGRAATVGDAEHAISIHPSGTQVQTIHDGPAITGDLWPRLRARIQDKALQTISKTDQATLPAWIRIEVSSSLFLLSSLHLLDLPTRLAALSGNVADALERHPHVLGVILSLPISLIPLPNNVTFTAPVESRRSGMLIPSTTAASVALASGPLAIGRNLPGGRSRSAFVLPNKQREDLSDPLSPGLMLGLEPTWLDWALSRLGLPSFSELIDSDGSVEAQL